LAAASTLSLSLWFYPYALGTEMSPAVHSALPLLLLGVSAAFVYGVGFTPENRALRVVFSPPVAWPLLILGVFLLASV
jgi:predicted membrane protein